MGETGRDGPSGSAGDSSGDFSGDCSGGSASEGLSSVGSTLCGVWISEGLNLVGGSSPGGPLKLGSLKFGSLTFGSLILGRSNFGGLAFHLSISFFIAAGSPAASGAPSSPR